MWTKTKQSVKVLFVSLVFSFDWPKQKLLKFIADVKPLNLKRLKNISGNDDIKNTRVII
jgi:hypothetical protein